MIITCLAFKRFNWNVITCTNVGDFRLQKKQSVDQIYINLYGAATYKINWSAAKCLTVREQCCALKRLNWNASFVVERKLLSLYNIKIFKQQWVGCISRRSVQWNSINMKISGIGNTFSRSLCLNNHILLFLTVAEFQFRFQGWNIPIVNTLAGKIYRWIPYSNATDDWTIIRYWNTTGFAVICTVVNVQSTTHTISWSLTSTFVVSNYLVITAPNMDVVWTL